MAGPLWYDRVMEVTSTTGTGALALGGAVTGYQAWSVVGNGNSAYYCVYDVDSVGNPLGVWETGLGTYASAGNTLARTTVHANSSGGATALDLAAGVKRVILTPTANHLTTTPVVNGGTGLNALGTALQVLRVNAGATALEYAAAAAGGSPGGSDGNLQYKSGSDFAGLAASTVATSGTHLALAAQAATDVAGAAVAHASQSANLWEWRLSGGTVRGRVTSAGAFSNTTGQTGGEAFGAGASVAGIESVAVGASAVSQASSPTGRGVAVGFEATVSGAGSGDSTAVGWRATCSGGRFQVAIGAGATASTAQKSLAIGNDAVSSGGQSVAIGANATASGAVSLALGSGTTASGAGSVAMGVNAVSSAAGTMNFHGNTVDPVFALSRESSTTINRFLVSVAGSFADPTDATRKARAVFNVYDTAAREALRLEASGSAPMVGFLGATATARESVTGSRGGNAALADLLTKLATKGLITDGTSA